jgi:hypothetical protein
MELRPALAGAAGWGALSEAEAAAAAALGWTVAARDDPSGAVRVVISADCLLHGPRRGRPREGGEAPFAFF